MRPERPLEMGWQMPFQMVLTASIHPNGMFVKVSDSVTREKQYLGAVEALLRTASPLVGGVTLIENTGADLNSFHELADRENRYQKKVEFISLNLNDYPREYGIGYGEFRLLDAGIAASKILTPDHHLVKLTGRLIVSNLTSMLGAMPEAVDMALDLKPSKDVSSGWCDSRLMVFSYNFYQSRIVGMYKQVNGTKNVTAEHCLYQVVRNSPGARIMARLPREPQWVGYSGSTGMQYDSWKMRVKYPLKAIWRAMSRWLNVPDLRAVWASVTPEQAAPANRSPAAVN